MSTKRDGAKTARFDSMNERGFVQLIRAVTSAEYNEISCAECQRHFPALYQLDKGELDKNGVGNDGPGNGIELAAQELADAVQHLTRCLSCAEEYKMLREAVAELEAGTLPELAEPPRFDLSFLDSEALEEQPDSPQLWQTAGAGRESGGGGVVDRVQTLFTNVLVQIDGLAASFGTLPAPLVPQPVPGQVFRSTSPETEIEALILPASDAEISIQLLVGPVSQGRATIQMKLMEIDTAAPIPGVRATLRNASKQLLEGSVTGRDGDILFQQLAPGRYFVQVRHNRRMWEIPLVIVKGERNAGDNAA